MFALLQLSSTQILAVYKICQIAAVFGANVVLPLACLIH